MELVIRFATALFGALAESAPYLVAGYLLVALIREFVPPATLTKYLGGRGPRPLLNALGIGALLPVCSCGSIPLGIGLARSGAAVGTVLTLMTSSPAISPVSLALGYTLLGPRLLVVLVAVVLVGSFLIGLVGNLWLHVPAGKSLPVARPNEAGGNDCCEPTATGTGTRLRRAVRWAYWDLGADVSLDLLIGLAAAAAILAFVPTEWATAWLGQSNAWAILCVILVSIPMYTCSIPAMLVVHSLLMTGAGPGAAVAFLVAGPATNLGEINAIRGSMGNRTAAFYSVALILVALAGGIVTDHVVYRDSTWEPPAIDVADVAGHTAGHTVAGLYEAGGKSAVAGLYEAGGRGHRPRLQVSAPAWHYPFVVVLMAVMVLGIARRVERMRKKSDCCDMGDGGSDER